MVHSSTRTRSRRRSRSWLALLLVLVVVAAAVVVAHSPMAAEHMGNFAAMCVGVAVGGAVATVLGGLPRTPRWVPELLSGPTPAAAGAPPVGPAIRAGPPLLQVFLH